MCLLNVSELAGELSAVKFYVEILTGLTFALIIAVGFATWKVSDREVKVIEKDLKDDFNSQFDLVKKKITELPIKAKVENQEGNGITTVNHWVPKKDYQSKLECISISNIKMYELDSVVTTNSYDNNHDNFMVTPKNISIHIGVYHVFESET